METYSPVTSMNVIKHMPPEAVRLERTAKSNLIKFYTKV